LGLLFGMYSSAGEMTCARYGIALILSSHMIRSNVYVVL
jgi:hypothetical protein